MKIFSLTVVAAVGLSLAGCYNQYIERKDTVSFNAGDAVAWNAAQQIPTPTPKGVNDTRLVLDGDKAARAAQRNIDGNEKWMHDKSDELSDTLLPRAPGGVSTGGSSGGGGGGGTGSGVTIFNSNGNGGGAGGAPQ